MSDMLYIAHFARAQLKAAQEKGMEGEQLAALLNALNSEANALTPGGGYVVCYAAKALNMIELLPEVGGPLEWAGFDPAQGGT